MNPEDVPNGGTGRRTPHRPERAKSDFGDLAGIICVAMICASVVAIVYILAN